MIGLMSDKFFFNKMFISWIKSEMNKGHCCWWSFTFFFVLMDFAIYSFVILESKDLQSLLDLQKPCEPHRIRSDLPLSLTFRKFHPLYATVQDL